MKGNRAVLVAAVAVVLLGAGWWFFVRGGGGHPIDLIAAFETAHKRPSAEVFSIVDARLKDETRKAIAIQALPGSRIIFKVRVPDDAWLSVSLGLKPEAWEGQGNGVLFMVGVSDGRTFQQLFTQHVNPFADKNERRWISVMVDLSTYSGEDVDLIFNTYSSEPNQPENHDNDLALWGSPEIVIR